MLVQLLDTGGLQFLLIAPRYAARSPLPVGRSGCPARAAETMDAMQVESPVELELMTAKDLARFFQKVSDLFFFSVHSRLAESYGAR